MSLARPGGPGSAQLSCTLTAASPVPCLGAQWAWVRRGQGGGPVSPSLRSCRRSVCCRSVASHPLWKPAPPFSGRVSEGAPPGLQGGLTGELRPSCSPRLAQGLGSSLVQRLGDRDVPAAGVSRLPVAGRHDHHLPADTCLGTCMWDPKRRTGDA